MSNVPKPVWLLMAASLALNLFFLGLWSGRHWSRRDREMSAELPGAHAFLRRSGLSDAGPAVHKIIDDQRGSVRQRMRDLSEARAEVRAALQAEPFDGARLDSAFVALEARSGAMQHDMHVGLSKLARAVNAEQRARMAEALWPRFGTRHRERGP